MLLHNTHRAGDELRCGGRILPQGTVIHESGAIRGDVAHRCQIYIDTKIQKNFGLFFRICQNRIHAAACIDRAGRCEALFTQTLVAADTHHGASLFIYRQQKRHTGGCL